VYLLLDPRPAKLWLVAAVFAVTAVAAGTADAATATAEARTLAAREPVGRRGERDAGAVGVLRHGRVVDAG